MKTLKSAGILLLISFLSSVHAQSVVLCESYDTDGKASGIYSSWDISSSGSYIYILFSQNAPIRGGLWYLYIDKDYDNTGVYSPIETIEIKPETGKKWFVHDQKFTSAGKYKAAVMRDGIEQASTYFELGYKEGETTNSASDEPDTYYYENSIVQFCTSVDASGNPVGVSESFKLNAEGSVTVAVYVENDGNPFKTDKFNVDIFDDKENAVDSYSLDIQPEWDYVKFEQKFNRPGVYYVDIYTANDVFINTGTVTIEVR